MKKLFSLVSLLTCLAFGGTLANSSSVELPSELTDTETTYIVTIDQGVNSSKAASTRNRVLNEIKYQLPNGSYTIENVYSKALNGFAITINSTFKDYLESLTGVASVEEEHTYAAPVVETNATGATTLAANDGYKTEKLENYSAETMEATSNDIAQAVAERSGGTAADITPQAGKGITIGIIDTGLYLNQVTGTTQRKNLESSGSDYNAAAFVTDDSNVTDVLTQEKIDAAISANGDFNGKNYSRYGNKIAFAYDYNGEDNNVDTNSEHGTHVASLAAGNGADFQGIAPNAQLAIMKVFPDDGSGASDSDILQAIEDSLYLGLDVINLSLGTDLYDFDDGVSGGVHTAIDNAVEAGVIVNYAAGNSGKSSFSGTKGYSDWTTDTVESSYLGGETLYDEKVNVVASSNPDRAFYDSIVMVDGNVVSYYDQVINRENSSLTYDEPHAFTDLLGDGESEGTFTYARLDGVGNAASYNNFYQAYNTEHSASISSLSDLDDTVIAVINRGDTTFQNKVQVAENNGADALIVVNNEPSVTFNFNFDFNDYNPRIPVILVFQSAGSYFGTNNSVGELSIQTNQAVDAPDGNIISSFSSDGPTHNLDISPEVAAPGNSVIGAVSAAVTGSTSGLAGYDNLSGTSMAAPNFSGGLAAILSEFYPDNDSELALEDANAFDLYKQKISNIVMSSADQLNDSSAESLGSVRLQGAGIINVADAIGNSSYVTSKAVDDSQSTASSDAVETTEEDVSKAELKNRGGLYHEDLSQDEEAYIEFSYTIHNESSETKYYTPSVNLMIPNLQIQMTQADFDSSYENDPSTVDDVAENLPGAITMSINDEMLDVPSKNITTGSLIQVDPNSTKTETIKVRIDNIEFSHEFDTYNPDDQKEVEDFEGTLREYFNTYFDDAGGSYVEGYLYLTESDASGSRAEVDHILSMPYLGFYGDYTKGAAVEPFQFEKEDGHLYNSELADSYLQNLTNYSKPRCYTGSTLTATNHALNNSEIANIANLNGSAYQDGSNYLSIVQEDENGNTYLKAGSAAASYLVSVFYVNRSVSEATWSISDGSRTVSSGSITSIYESTQYPADYGLVKSHVVSGNSGYAMHHGYACINLTGVAEGTYTLSYNFTLRGTGTTQTNSYTLVVDKTPPVLQSAEIVTTDSNSQQLILTTIGGDASAYCSGTTYTPVAGSGDDVYIATINLTNRLINQNTLNITITDTAYNTIYVMLTLSNLNTVIYGENVPTTGSYALQQVSNSGGYYNYDFVLTDATGDDLYGFNSTVNIQLYIGKDVDAETLSILLNYEDLDPSQYSYDASTGYVTLYDVELEDGGVQISISTRVTTPETDTPSTDPEEPTDPDDPTPDPGDQPEDPIDPVDPTDPEEPEGGLEGWQIALIAVAAVVVVAAIVVGIVFFLKKKKKA